MANMIRLESTEDRKQIESLVSEVDESLKSHDVHRLKKANAALDEGTQHLATLLIDRAMATAANATIEIASVNNNPARVIR